MQRPSCVRLVQRRAVSGEVPAVAVRVGGEGGGIPNGTQLSPEQFLH